ncbi:MAG: hypothetical protein HYU70_12550, partial [Bacteroidetes bacterium]|nr:hypothetical protein [Bacteroidota bacterium]
MRCNCSLIHQSWKHLGIQVMGDFLRNNELTRFVFHKRIYQLFLLVFVLLLLPFFSFSQLTGGTISATGCQTYNTAHFVGQTAAITGQNGLVAITYTWERSTDLAFTSPTIVGAGGTDLSDNYTFTGRTYYRRKVENDGNTAYSNIVTIDPNPVIGISPTSPSACLGDLSFSVTYGTLFDPNRYSIVWGGAASGVFPDVNTGLTTDNLIGTPGTLVVPISAAAGTGTFTGTLTVLNTTTGCTTSGSASLVVNALPTATITAGGLTTICTGESVTLTAGGGTSYVWSTGSALNAISVASSGSITVTATDINGCKATSSPTT